MKLSTLPVRRKSGITLLEMTVVILVLIGLVAILFIGARAWKKGSDRASNIMNIRNVQQAVRGHANVRGLMPGDPLDVGQIVGSGRYVRNLTPPALEIIYAYGTTVPTIGTLYLNATYAGSSADDYAPTPGSYADW